MTRTSRSSWLPRWLRPTPAVPYHRPPTGRLRCELLEDRLVPATNYIEVITQSGVGLGFLAGNNTGTTTNFTEDATDPTGKKYSVGNVDDTVKVGFAMGSADTLVPLLQFTIDNDDDGDFAGSLLIDTGKKYFEIQGAAMMDMIVVGGKTGVPIPIWKQTDVGDQQGFDIPTLLGFGSSTGQTVEGKSVVGISVLNTVDFDLSGLVLAHDSTTNAPQVMLQGTGTLTNETLLKKAPFIHDLKVVVADENYVVASATGITVTGLEGELDLAAKPATLGGMDVTGKVQIGYTDNTGPNKDEKEISIGGNIELTSPAGSPAKLKNVGGGLDLTLTIYPDHSVKFDGFGVDVNGSFEVLGLGVSTLQSEPFSFNYHIGDEFDTLSIGGGLQFSLKGNTVVLEFGSASSPGLEIDFKATGTEVSLNNAILNGDINIEGVRISTSQPPGGLTISYDGTKSLLQMSGGISVTMPSGTENFTATLNKMIYDTAAKDLQELSFAISGSFSLGGLSVRTNNMGFDLQAADPNANPPTSELFEISGDLVVDFKAFQASVSLGSGGGKNDGLVYQDGDFQVKDFTIEVENVPLGPLQLNDLKVHWDQTKDGSYDLEVDVGVRLPAAGQDVAGSFVLKEGHLDSISISYLSEEGIELGTSGAFLISVDASVKNIENPSQIVVEGKVGVVYGNKISMLDRDDIYLFHAEGDVTVDADEFILDCTVQIGAWSTDNGRTWQGVLGQAEGKLDLNWHTQIYSLHVEADGVFGVFDFEGDLVFSPGREVALLAEAEVVIPTWVPFIGGDTLGGFGFYFQHVIPHDDVPASTTLAAWIDIEVIWTVTVGFEVVIDAAGNANWGSIGASDVTKFKQSLTNMERTFTYVNDLTGLTPAGATSLLAQVDWSQGAEAPLDGPPKLRVQRTLNNTTTTFTEDQFAANGITIIGDSRLTGSKSVTIQIADPSATSPYQPLQGDYVILVDVLADTNPFPDFPNPKADDRLTVQVTGHIPQPIFGDIGSTTPYQPTLPTTAPAATFPVTVTGNVDPTFLGKTKASLYRVSLADPYRRPVLVQTVGVTGTGGTGGSGFSASFNVPIDSLAPSAYTLFAVVDDGVNPPVTTDPSVEFTPNFAVQGTVNNQNGTPITGQTVFLDYNGNFFQDPNEPHKLTGPNGYAFTANFDPSTGWASVPGNKTPFQVVLPALSNRVGDAGFETPKAPFTSPPATNPLYWYNTPGTPWTFNGDSGLVANGSGFGNANAPEGTQAAFLQMTGNFSQTVNLAAGTYRLSFQAAQRPGNQQTFDVKVTDSSGQSFLLNSFQPTGTSYQAYTTDSFTVPAGSYTIEFSGTNEHAEVNNGDNTAFIDIVGCTQLDNFDPVATSMVTFDGTNTVNQPFALKEHTAIKGVVYDDTDSNGDPAAGLPVGGALAYLDTNNNNVRDAGEPTATTDAGGGYNFTGLAAGNYTVRIDLTTVGRGVAAPAIVVPAGTPGTEAGPQAGQLTYGLPFTTERAVVVTSLGVFDDNGDGLTAPLTVVLYDADTQVELARQVFTPAAPGTLVGGTRYLDLPSPITLRPGFNGMIAAYGFGATADRVGNAVYLPAGSKVPWTADDGAGRLSFGTLVPNPLDRPLLPPLPKVVVDGITATTPNTYPTIPDYAGAGTPYAAGSFLYRDIPWAASPQSPASYDVTLDGSVYDLVEGKDLGLLPPTVFFGTVTGEPLVNGVPQASAPQAGWTVGLLTDRVVLAINAGGANALGFVADGYFDAGQIQTTAMPIDTSRVAGAPAQAIYQDGRVGVNGEGFNYVIPGLDPGASYTVRLHFAEIDKLVEVAGQRKFNVSINGTQVLFDFDIVAAAGSPNTAYARDFPATADGFGRITLAFTAGSANVPLVNAIQLLSPAGVGATPAKLAVDSGGDGTGNFVADQYVTGGSVAAWWGDINMGSAFDPAPEPVYHTLRVGGQITYTLPGFEPGRPYTVRLHFADFGVSGPDQRKFNVDINNRRVLTDFDVAAAAGQPWEIGYAFAAYFDAVADQNGQIVINFTKGSKGQPIVSGVEVFEPTNVVDSATTDVQGNYALVAYGAGEYTVVESPPPGWQQLTPEYTTPTFAPTPMEIVAPNRIGSTSDEQWATADFNGDGRMDVVVGSLQPRDGISDWLFTTVLYSQPDGSFKAQQANGAVAVTWAVPLVTVGDFNGDHRPDLAFLHSGWLDGGAWFGTYVYVFLNTGDPANPFNGFQAPAWNPIKVRPTPLVVGEFYSAMASGDFDGDGRDDLVLGTSLGYEQSARMVYIENVTASTPSVTSYTLPEAAGVPSYYNAYPYAIRALSVTDADADGDRDVVMMTVVYSDLFNSDTGYGYGHPVLAVAYRDGAGWHGPVTGGLPANDQTITGMAVVPPRPGQPATLIATTPFYTIDTTTTAAYNESSFQVLTGAGNGGFYMSEVDLPEQGQPKAPGPNLRLLSGPRLADVNADGLPDLVNLFAPTMASQAISIRINNGGSGAAMFDWAAPILLPLPANLTQWVGDFEVADFDGDGLNDILVPLTGDPSGSINQPALLFRNETPQARPGRTVYAAAGDAVTGLDFHSAQTPAKSAVHGRVFEDVNRNGTHDPGDTPTAGVAVFADLNRNGRLDSGEPQSTTTAAGHYTLSGLADGTYSVGVVPDANWKGTVPASEFQEVTIANGSVMEADFGRVRRLLGTVESQTVRVGGSLDTTILLTDAATGRRLVHTLEGTVPAGMSIDPATGRLTWSPTVQQVGMHTVTVRVRDPFDPAFTETQSIAIEVTPPVVPPVPPVAPRTPLIAASGNGAVRVFTTNGTPQRTLKPFGDAFVGEVRVATGDVTGDGVDDVIAAAGPGGGPHVKVFDGATGAEIRSFFAFEPSFTGGLYVAAGDVDGDGHADLVVGAGVGGGPRVKVLSGRDLSVLSDFFAFESSFRGGVTVAAGDVTGDGFADLVIGTGPGGGPRVRVIDGKTGADVADFFAFDPTFRGGVLVAAGDVTGDGIADVVTSPGAGGGPRVRLFDGTDLTTALAPEPLADFLAGADTDRGGVQVAAKPPAGNQPGAVVVGSGDRGRVTAYRLPATPAELPTELFDFDMFTDDLSGVMVG